MATHINKKGERVTCHATTRKCTYKNETDSTSVIKPSDPVNLKSPEDIFNKLEEDKLEPNDDTNFTEESDYSITIPSHRLDEAKHRIAIANRKLERQGIEERFEYTTEDEVKNIDGTLYFSTKIILNYPSIKEEGWTFVASLDMPEETTEIISRAAPGQTIGNDLPEKFKCEECGSNRKRHKTYLLRHENGTVKQIGSTCVEKFLGVKPRGLWALQYDLEEQVSDRSFQSTSLSRAFNTEDVLCYALAVSKDGDEYIPKTSEYENNPATATLVRNLMFKNGLTSSEIESKRELAREIIKNKEYSNNSDYGVNMNKLLRSPIINHKHIGYVVSAVKKERVAVKVKKAVGYFAEPGKVIEDVPVKVLNVSFFQTNYGYTPQTVKLIVLEAEDGRQLVWSTSSIQEDVDNISTGDKLFLHKAKVKSHKVFNGNEQTAINYTKFTNDSEKEKDNNKDN